MLVSLLTLILITLTPTQPPTPYWIKPSGGPPTILAWSPDSSLLAVGTSKRTIITLTKNGKLQWHYKIDSCVYCVSWSPDGTMLAAGISYPDYRIYVFSKDGELKW